MMPFSQMKTYTRPNNTAREVKPSTMNTAVWGEAPTPRLPEAQARRETSPRCGGQPPQRRAPPKRSTFDCRHSHAANSLAPVITDRRSSRASGARRAVTPLIPSARPEDQRGSRGTWKHTCDGSIVSASTTGDDAG